MTNTDTQSEQRESPWEPESPISTLYAAAMQEMRDEFMKTQRHVAPFLRGAVKQAYELGTIDALNYIRIIEGEREKMRNELNKKPTEDANGST